MLRALGRSALRLIALGAESPKAVPAEALLKAADTLSARFAQARYPSTQEQTSLLLADAIPDDVVAKRMKGSPEVKDGTLEQRLKDYHREMDMVTLYYPAADIIAIDATPNIATVTKKINEALDLRLKK